VVHQGESLADFAQNDRQNVVIRDADETDREFADLAAARPKCSSSATVTKQRRWRSSI